MKQNTDETIAIELAHISKSFKLPHQKNNSLKGLFVNMFRGRRRFEKQLVLDDISFTVKKGEFLGVVGRNGGGKSTLLKLLAEIYSPDGGDITVNGDLTPFIELGVGFNPDLTGRENVFLNGALLGFSHKEMEAMYDDIVAFAELERFMDQKLKNYSSGMQVRLAFSVAVQARTDILLIDEVLAVGDANFQEKCFGVFENFKKEGRTVIFISHSMQMVTKFCDRAILLKEGRIKAVGEPEVIAAEYEMLNDAFQKDNKQRLEIKNQREAHIVDNVLNNFNIKDVLLEIGSGSGRHVELINSFGQKTYGIDKSEQTKATKGGLIFRSLADLSTTSKIEGLLLLDNLKSIGFDYLREVFTNLKKGSKLASVSKIYVHLPFDEYQSYRQSKDKNALSHLGIPLDVLRLANELKTYNFILTSSSLYGADEPCQYREAIFEKFDAKKERELWESSTE
jgi:ABC-type polysaccharide/polyol phosphate transport system ATPase subunit